MAAPAVAIVSHEPVDRPRKRGRTIATRTRAPGRNRRAPVATGPKAVNTVVARAEAVWSEAQLATMQAGPTSRGANPATALAAGRVGGRFGGPVHARTPARSERTTVLMPSSYGV